MTNISNKKIKKPRLKGFAKLLGSIIDSVKDTEECKFFLIGVKTRVLLNFTDGKWATLITVKDGNIIVEGVRNEPKSNLKRKKLFWWGYFEGKSEDFFVKSANWSFGKLFRKMAEGKVKGASQIAIIGEILKLAASTRTPLPSST
ncbi:MAG: hypothetical protein ACFFAN_12515 [Promethearchaeota archaeon]